MTTDDEQRLSTSLRERAEGITTGSADLVQVRARARGIRRRRRAGGLAAAGLVVAVVLPFATHLGDGTRADRSVPPATSRSDARPLTAVGAPRSGPPKIAYQQGRTLHRADGSTLRLPAAYSSLTPYRGGFLVTDSTDAASEVVVLDKDLRAVRRTVGERDLVVSADGARVAWASLGERRDGGARALLHLDSAGDPSGSTEEQTAPAIGSTDGVKLVGFLDPLQLVYKPYGRTGVWVLDQDGGSRQLEGLVSAGGTSQRDGLVSGTIDFTTEGLCAAVRDVTGPGGELWRTCDFSLGRFSPDGRYVLAGSTTAGGSGDRQVAVLDAHTGAVVAHWRRPRDDSGVAAPSVWESDTTLLTPYREDGAWHLLRLSLGGQVSEAADPVPTSGEAAEVVTSSGDTAAPWTFTARP